MKRRLRFPGRAEGPEVTCSHCGARALPPTFNNDRDVAEIMAAKRVGKGGGSAVSVVVS